jgi:hypothetical protein
VQKHWIELILRRDKEGHAAASLISPAAKDPANKRKRTSNTDPQLPIYRFDGKKEEHAVIVV